MKNIFFKISLICAILFAVPQSTIAQSNNAQVAIKGKIYKTNVPQFKKLVDSGNGTILDVRTPKEWTEGTIGDAVKINYYADDFAKKVDQLDKSKPVFVYCKKGGRSAGAAEI